MDTLALGAFALLCILRRIQANNNIPFYQREAYCLLAILAAGSLMNVAFNTIYPMN